MFQEIHTLLPDWSLIRQRISKAVVLPCLQEKQCKKFVEYRCSVTPEIATGFRLSCFVQFYFTVIL